MSRFTACVNDPLFYFFFFKSPYRFTLHGFCENKLRFRFLTVPITWAKCGSQIMYLKVRFPVNYLIITNVK